MCFPGFDANLGLDLQDLLLDGKSLRSFPWPRRSIEWVQVQTLVGWPHDLGGETSAAIRRNKGCVICSNWECPDLGRTRAKAAE
jgi:hypothetical protein